MTVAELVKKALRLGNIVDATATLEAHELENGRDALNSMLYRWSSLLQGVHSLVRESFTLTESDGEYSIGASGDFDTVRPTRIISAFIRYQNIDYPLEIIFSDDYSQLAQKALETIPCKLYVNPTYPTSTILLWPVPDQAYELHIDSHKPLGQYSTTSATITLPPEYEDALKWNLHVDLCAEFGVEPSSVAVARADQSFKDLKRLHSTPGKRVTTSPFGVRRGNYDIYGDVRY